MKRIVELSRSTLVQNAAALYGVQLFRKAVPLVTVPYVTRVLGPAGWGVVAFTLSFSMMLVMVVEFGFPISATREIARSRTSSDASSAVVSGVVGLQVLLLSLGMLVALIVSRFVPALGAHPRVLAAGLFFAIAQGMTPFWFFQGMERLKFTSMLDVIGKSIGMTGLFLFVHGPQDDWLVLLCQGVGPCATTIYGFYVMYRSVPFRLPSSLDLKNALMHGWSMFVYRVGTGLYATANVFVLGLFAPSYIVGYFASAEKIASAVLGLLNPIQEALFPRLSSLAKHSPENTNKLALNGALVMLSGGMVLGSMLFVFAPVIVHALAGPKFAEAVPALRILALLLPLGALVNSAGLQWLLPLGRDRIVNTIIISAGITDLALAITLAPRFGHIGMAWAAVCAEACLGFGLLAAVARTAPFWLRTVPVVHSGDLAVETRAYTTNCK